MQRLALVAACAAPLLLLAACSSDDEHPTIGTTTAAATRSESTSASTSPSPTDGASPSVEPASGPVVAMPNAELRGLEGWKKDRGFIDIQAGADTADNSQAVLLMAIELPSGGETPVGELGKVAIRNSSVTPKPELLDPVEIGDVEWYHTYSDGGDANTEHSFGVDYDGYQTTIVFKFDDEVVSEEEQQATMDSVLASFTWK